MDEPRGSPWRNEKRGEAQREQKRANRELKKTIATTIILLSFPSLVTVSFVPR